MARVLNIAMDMIVENADPKKQAEVVRMLTGPYRTMGDKISPEDLNAPAWWHGDEEAYESVQGFTGIPMRR